MKVAEYHWEHPILKRYQKEYTPSQWLFHQGSPAGSLFVIVRGVIQLFAERDGAELLISTLEAGQVLGERALLTGKPGKRFFGARAKTQASAVELTLKDIDRLEKEAPQLISDILKRICQISVERQDRLDHLVKVLRPSDNIERLVYLIVHFCHFEGRETPKGIEILLPTDSLRYYIAMSEFEIEECLKKLHEMGVFVSEGHQTYLLTDQEALLGSVESLRENLPSIPSI